jgi:transposase-like protein
MKTARPRSEGRAELAEYYRALLEEQAQGELSVREFAEEVGVSAATLYSWRRRLDGSAEVKEAGDLLEVQVTGDAAVLQRGASIVLTVDGRVRIELEADFDAGALERLLRLLSRC